MKEVSDIVIPERLRPKLKLEKDMSVVEVIEFRMPPARKKKLSVKEELFSAEPPRLSDLDLVLLLPQLHRPSASDMTSCLLRLKNSPKAPKILSILVDSTNDDTELEKQEQFTLPLWSITYWIEVAEIAVEQETWRGAAKLMDKNPKMRAALASISWNHPLPKEMGYKLSDLALFGADEWCSDVQVDIMVAVINKHLEQSSAGHDQKVLATAFSFMLISHFRTRRDHYRDSGNIQFIRDVGELLSADALKRVGLCFSVYSPRDPHVSSALPEGENKGNHWVSAVIDTSTHQILYSDSLHRKPPPELVKVLEWWLGHHFDETFTLDNLQCSRQFDESSCAIRSVNSIAHYFDPGSISLISSRKEATQNRHNYISAAVDILKGQVDKRKQSSSTLPLTKQIQETGQTHSAAPLDESMSSMSLLNANPVPGEEILNGESEANIHPVQRGTKRSADANDTDASRKDLHDPGSKRTRPNFSTPPRGPPVQTRLRPLEDLPSTKAGYTSMEVDDEDETMATPEEDYERLRDEGWTYVRWKGDTDRPLLDSEKRIFGVLAGRPQDPSYDEACKAVYELMVQEGENERFTSSQKKHKRGAFPAVNVGVGQGPGNAVPHNLALSDRQAEMMERLMSNPHMIKLAEAQDDMFQRWAPKLHDHYKKTLGKLWKWGEKPENNKQWKLNFANSVWPTAAFNFGGKVWCHRHRDCMNLAYGWCAITALGNFDPTKGGHLVLADLRMIIEFPPGSVILIPSATLLHSNIPVRCKKKKSSEAPVEPNETPNSPAVPEETRISFTQYGPGSLFRFVDWGFQTIKHTAETDSAQFKENRDVGENGWERGIQFWSTLDELEKSE